MIKIQAFPKPYTEQIQEMMTINRIKIAKIISSKVQGSVNTWCDYPTESLYIEIYNDYTKLPYKFTVYQIVDRILDGESAQDIADFVLSRYKSQIMRKFFKLV